MLEALARANFERDVAAIDRRVAEKRGWTIVGDEFPVLDIVFNVPGVRPVRLRFNCEDFDEMPPYIEILEPDGGEMAQLPADPLSRFNSGPNPYTGRKFICMRGSRCYHQQHREDQWDNHRGKPDVALGEIANQLFRVWSRIAS